MTGFAPLDIWIICCMLGLAVFGVIAMSAWKGDCDDCDLSNRMGAYHRHHLRRHRQRHPVFGAWLMWWPDIKATNEMRKRAATDELMAARIRRVVREDYLRAKFDEESA